LVDEEEGKKPCNDRIKGKYPTNVTSQGSKVTVIADKMLIDMKKRL